MSSRLLKSFAEYIYFYFIDIKSDENLAKAWNFDVVFKKK